MTTFTSSSMIISALFALNIVILHVSLAFFGVSNEFSLRRGVNMVLTLSKPLSMLPNTGVRLLGVSILFNSLSTDCDLSIIVLIIFILFYLLLNCFLFKLVKLTFWSLGCLARRCWGPSPLISMGLLWLSLNLFK